MAEEEYESDPEDSKLSGMRRRHASDDEEEGEDLDGDKSPPPPLPRARSDSRIGIGSDGESDGQGGVAEYDDDEEEEEVDDVVEDEEEEYLEVDEEGFEDQGVDADGGDVEVVGVQTVNELEAEENGAAEVPSSEGDSAEQGVEGEEKKVNDPVAVPRAGAFYMHDDRFSDSSGGRNRSTHARRELWEFKDVGKWGHDKFEEMSSQERRYEEGRRNPRVQHRGRGRNRGGDRGYVRGGRTRARTDNQIAGHAPKVFRGRGPRKYEAVRDFTEARQTQNRHRAKPVEKPSQATSQRAYVSQSNGDSDLVPARNQAFASSLNVASPPFYPSGSSTKEITLPQKKDVQAGVSNKNPRSQASDERFYMPQSNSSSRGKNIVEGMDNLYIEDLVSSSAGKPSTNMQMPSLGSSSNNSTQYHRARPQERGLAHPGQMNFTPNSSHMQVNRAPPARLNESIRNRVQPSMQAPAQFLSHQPGSGSQSSSPPKTALSSEAGDIESIPESSKSKTALVGRGRGVLQGSGRGTVLYGGASGNMGTGRGDQNFPGTPAFLPVMNFGGQHPGGMGVPAVGMAFPGYVAQPQLGMGSSEMTWLPVLAGAGALGAGALGATYCSPYMAVDGKFQARPSGQSPAGATSKENNTSRPNNEWKPSPRQELVSDEFGQRQNKPRRYSEMNFGQ